MEDRAVFGFDIKTDFDWKEYLVIYVQVFQPIANYVQQTAAKNQCAKKNQLFLLLQGIRKFLFKSDPSTIPSSRRYMNLLWWVDLLTKAGQSYQPFTFLFLIVSGPFYHQCFISVKYSYLVAAEHLSKYRFL